MSLSRCGPFHAAACLSVLPKIVRHIRGKLVFSRVSASLILRIRPHVGTTLGKAANVSKITNRMKTMGVLVTIISNFTDLLV